MLFDKKIFMLDIEPKSKEDVLRTMAREFRARDLVTDDFEQGILEREEVFPTGLCFNGLGIAIPHTDSDKVIDSQIAIARLKHHVIFKEMAGNNPIEVKLVFMLGLKEADEHLSILQKLVEVFQEGDFVDLLCGCQSAQDVEKLLVQYHLYKGDS